LIEVRAVTVLDLDGVEAERRLNVVANLTDAERERGLFEGRHHLAAAEEPEVAALPRAARVLAVFRGERGEVRAGSGPLLELASERLRAVALRRRGVRRQAKQDVARADLEARLLFLVQGAQVLVRERGVHLDHLVTELQHDRLVDLALDQRRDV